MHETERIDLSTAGNPTAIHPARTLSVWDGYAVSATHSLSCDPGRMSRRTRCCLAWLEGDQGGAHLCVGLPHPPAAGCLCEQYEVWSTIFRVIVLFPKESNFLAVSLSNWIRSR